MAAELNVSARNIALALLAFFLLRTNFLYHTAAGKLLTVMQGKSNLIGLQASHAFFCNALFQKKVGSYLSVLTGLSWLAFLLSLAGGVQWWK